MDLKAILGDQYRPDMTQAELEAALAGIVVHTDAEVKANYVSKNLFDRTASQLAEAKRNSSSAAAQAKTENEQLMERIATLENEAKENKRAAAIARDTASYVALGYTEELARSTAEALADGDTAKVNANMAAFITQKTQSIREELMKGSTPPAAGGTGGAVDYAKLKTDALNAGNDVEYMRLCREEMEQANKK